MSGGAARQRRWEKERKEVYEGSMMHFFRSIYTNTIIKEGFEVRFLQKKVNEEKVRVKQIFSKLKNGKNVILKKDSAAYYKEVMKQEDHFQIVGQHVLPGDSIAYAVDRTTAGLYFPDYLLITYINKKAPEGYIRMFPQSEGMMTSQLHLLNNVPIEIQSNGIFYNGADLLNLGYWSWSEKMSHMLPYDYKFPKK